MAFLEARGMPATTAGLAREHVEAWIAELLETRAPATAMSRYQALRQWFGWLVEEGEMTDSPMLKMKGPIVPEVPIPVLTDEALRTLLGSCAGKTFVERRDQAILRLFVDCGLRLAELTGLRVEDVDFDLGIVVVLGKGRRPRSVPFGDRTGQAVERWLRARATLPGVPRELGSLWMGKRGVMSPSGIRQMVWRRSEAAGIGRVFPHQLRHTFAHTWLAARRHQGGDDRPRFRPVARSPGRRRVDRGHGRRPRHRRRPRPPSPSSKGRHRRRRTRRDRRRQSGRRPG